MSAVGGGRLAAGGWQSCVSSRSSIHWGGEAQLERLAGLQPIAAARVSFRRAPSVVVGVGNEARNGDPLTLAIDGDEREIRQARQLPSTGEGFLGKDFDFNFERRRPGRGHARPEKDQIPDPDRVQELQAVDSGGDEHAARVTVRGDRAGDIDQVHHRTAEDESERIGIVRQNDLHHLGHRFRRSLGGLGHPADSELVLAVPIDKRLERAAKLRRQIVFVNRAEQRYGRLVGFQLGHAAGTGGEVPLEIGVLVGRQMMLDEVREKAHEVVAAAFLRHGQ